MKSKNDYVETINEGAIGNTRMQLIGVSAVAFENLILGIKADAKMNAPFAPKHQLPPLSKPHNFVRII